MAKRKSDHVNVVAPDWIATSTEYTKKRQFIAEYYELLGGQAKQKTSIRILGSKNLSRRKVTKRKRLVA